MKSVPDPRVLRVLRVLVVDDHPVVRQGLAMTLGRHPLLEVSGEAADLPEALVAIEKNPPDLVLADLDLEGSSGLDLIKRVKQEKPGIPVLILSMHDEETYAERVIRAGGRGYLMKNESPDRLIAGILAALKGEIVLSDRMKAKILANLAGDRLGASGTPVDRLTDRELEVFRLVSAGLTTRKMAEKLSLSVKTIEAHISHLKRKFRAESGRDLQRLAYDWASGPGSVES